MAQDLRKVNDIESLMTYFSEKLGWAIDPDDYYDIDDITYDFEAEDLGLKEEAFAKITSLKQLRPLVDEQRWGIFFVNFESSRFEVSALRKILSGLIPARRNADHAVWDKTDLLFLCTWGERNKVTIGAAYFEDAEKGLPQIKMISCEPAVEDFTQINIFEQRLSKLAWPKDPADTVAWHDAWASAFTTRYRQTIQDSHTLTVRLAEEAQNIRNRILNTLEIETSNGYVHLLFQKFRDTLVHDMTEQQFADMYAQTVVYGLFSARCMDETQEDFDATEAVECIPNTNPFLKGLVQECLGSNSANSKLSFDELEIGNIVDLLLHTKTDAIISDFNRQTGGGREDPVIHFYEEFLSEYDKAQKVQRGVYYTPQPVVNFIVRAVDDILKSEFSITDGLASTTTKTIKILRDSKRKIDGYIRTIEDEAVVPAIQILDPATGTGTFLRQTILQIYQNFCDHRKNKTKAEIQDEWNAYVPEHLLPRLNGFELMMAPYAVAHMKLAMVLKDTGYQFSRPERLRVYLTNSLEKPGNSEAQMTLWDDPLAFESVSANVVKKDSGINVIIGNPPYSGESANKGAWILQLMEDFKKEPGGILKLQEKNQKWLNDDYVKFIRYSENIISRTTGGVIAFINPHGFISNPTFRGMRWKLLQDFDKIYILDLHGNSNRKETCPDGSKDENVFDIQQGVCICIFIKTPANAKTKKCKVFHADILGLRNKKYDILNSSQLSDIQFTEVVPKEPDYLFLNVDYNLRSVYDEGFSVNVLFNQGSVGIVTARDGLTIDFSRNNLVERIDDFRKLDVENARTKYNLGKDVRDWKVEWAQTDINQNALVDGNIDVKKIIPIMYRPFDTRYTLFTGTSRGFICYPRADVMNNFILGNNIGLATARSNKSDSCDHFFVVNTIMEAKCAERTTQSAVFPLYLYSYAAGKLTRTVNMNKDIICTICNKTNLHYVESFNQPQETCSMFTEKDLLNYIYGVLYTPNYRSKYTEFINARFPKIPYPTSAKNFFDIAKLGERLVNLHLMRDLPKLSDDIDFIQGDNLMVEKIKYQDGKIFINKTAYFTGVTSNEWNFKIGGYQPLQRWYKDRKGFILKDVDISYYKQIINIIRETIIVMEELNNL